MVEPLTTTPPVKRRLKNYLLDPGFQLKYTGAVVAVTVLVGSVLGTIAYQYSREQTEALTAELIMREDEIDERTIAKIQGDAEAEDTRVLVAIASGIALMAVVLGLTGIVITHRVVGPVYKMRRLLKDVARGRLRFEGKLRKGDELQDLFDAFARMVSSLRERQEEEVAMLDAAIEQARGEGTPDSALSAVIEVRRRMRAALD